MSVPILCYHSVGEDCASAYRRWIVSPGQLERQLRAIRTLGYRIITVRELMQIRADGNRDGARVAVLTFDDGLADFASGAVPVLDRLGLLATLFVATGYVGETARWLSDIDEGNRPMLSLADLRVLSRHGIECGAHTHTHPQLDLLDTAEAAAEIETSRDRLADWLGTRPISFAYPHGYSTRAIRGAVAQAGFSSACRVAHALSDMDEDRFAMSRVIMTEDLDEAMLEEMFAGGLAMSPPNDSLPIRAWRLVRRIRGGNTNVQRQFSHGPDAHV